MVYAAIASNLAAVVAENTGSYFRLANNIAVVAVVVAAVMVQIQAIATERLRESIAVVVVVVVVSVVARQREETPIAKANFGLYDWRSTNRWDWPQSWWLSWW